MPLVKGGINNMEYNDFLKIDCSVFHLTNITEELYNLRENYCKSINGNCKKCKIKSMGYTIGLSCNGTLNKFPEECTKILKGEIETC
jgi:hypothetical protein